MHPLEPDDKEMRRLLAQATEFAVEFVEERQHAPAMELEGSWELADELRGGFPDEGRGMDELLEILERARGKGFDTAGPGYMAYIPGGGLFTAAVGDFLALVMNRFTNIAMPAPALVQLEANVVRWLCDLFGLPEESLGILTSGGSMANFSAVVAARVDRLGDDFSKGTLYASDQVHHSLVKAARLAGFPVANVREVPTDRDLRIDVGALEEAIAGDRSAGFLPFLVVGNAGTTNSGAVDPLPTLADVAQREDLWFHVDAAYGGFFQLTDRGRRAFAGVERADSITLDPHKGMFLPYGTGALLARDRATLRRVNETGGAYLHALAGRGEPPDFADYSPELSRDFRGLRVWLPLQLHGVGAFRDALDEKLDLARLAWEGISAIDALDVPWEPELSIVVFRLRSPDGDAHQANEDFLARINSARRAFLSSTIMGGETFLRVCVLSHRTHRDRVLETIDIIRAAAGP